MKTPAVSIIIRTKNEERWIGRCLRMVAQQDFKDFEVIIVDNRSADQTLSIARKFPVKIATVDRYRPGDALNVGIRASNGRFIACLSAHCIPRDERWLSSLVRNMERDDVAGVYGRQLPMSYSSPLDKRDLLNTFGLDHRIQVKDTFFHNANSLIRRAVWEKVPFDGAATNIEDRIWGKAVIERGLKLAYEPDAAVYHYHGIHQDGDQERARNVVRILESLGHQEHPSATGHALSILAVLPVLGKVVSIGGHNLLQRCLSQTRAAHALTAVAVISEDKAALALARKAGAVAVPRPKELLKRNVGVEEVLQHALTACEAGDTHYDAVVYANYLFPFRPKGFFDDLVAEFTASGTDSLVPAMKDYSPHWNETQNGLERSDAGLLPHDVKKPMQRGLIGLGTISSSEFVRDRRLLGDNVGLTPVDDRLYAMKANDPFDVAVIKLALEKGEKAFGRRA